MSNLITNHWSQFLRKPCIVLQNDYSRSASANDPELQLLNPVILKGWPTDKLGIPPEVLPYFPIRDELSVQDGLIFRGEHAVIPVTHRAILKDKIH